MALSSVLATHDADRKAVSARGAVRTAHTFDGEAVSPITAWGNRVLGLQSRSGRTMTAIPDFTQDRTGSLQGGRTSTLTLQVSSEGLATSNPSETELASTESVCRR